MAIKKSKALHIVYTDKKGLRLMVILVASKILSLGLHFR